MLAYAAKTPRVDSRAGSPKALALILAGHAALIAAVMTARMDVIPGTPLDPIDVIDIQPPPPPPPPDPRTKPEPKPQDRVIQDSSIDRTAPIIDMEQAPSFELDSGPTIADIGAVIGSGPTTVIDPPRHVPVKIAPRWATPDGAVKPPYPSDKLREQEEATLRLRLSIDTRGRVTAVEPVGAADPSFLAAARRHILKAWRYRSATEDGAAVSSSTVVTLSFRLEDV